MRYSIADLVTRAQAGRIGRKGLHRLTMAGLDANELAQSGVSGGVDVQSALDTRRDANFLRAIQRAQAATAAGHEVGAATKARLSHAPATDFGGGGFAFNPDTGAFSDGSLSALLDDYRKRRASALSSSKAYDL